MGISKTQALSVVFAAAKSYQENLVNHSLLFVYTDKHKRTYVMEVTFDKSNFKHLTGLKTDINAGQFFDLCINKRLSESDFEFADDGTTQLKLPVLSKIISKHMSAKMIGDYNRSMPKLYTEKLAGGITACIGFIRDNDEGRYIPNTVLEGDIRDKVESVGRIVITYRKRRDEAKYTEVVYKAKKVEWGKIRLPEEYKNLSLPKDENRVKTIS